jgi:hypothetical protein
MHALWIAACAVTVALAACSGPSNTPVAGAVLQPGQSIEATNRFGSVRVSYVSAQERKFEWDGKSRVVKMIARPEPFLGELGLYDPAECFVLLVPLCRTPRLVVLEAAHDFDSYDQLYAFIREGSAVMDWAYTTDGLLVGFGRSPGREQVDVNVRQLTIRGHRPARLQGARNQNIQMLTR